LLREKISAWIRGNVFRGSAACFTADLSGPWPLFAWLQPKFFFAFPFIAFGAAVDLLKRYQKDLSGRQLTA